MAYKNTILGVAFLLLVGAVSAKSGVGEVKKLYQETNSIIQKNSSRNILLYTVGGDDNYQWKVVSGASDQVLFDKNDYHASVFLKDGKIIRA